MAILHDSNEFFISFACYCFGKLWNWSDVIITPQGVKIYGAEYLDGPKIDFTEQVGIYYLRIYYLHKADDDDLFACRGWIARSLGETLETHASNFFNGNYDRFTWFGLCPVVDGMMGPLGVRSRRMIDRAKLQGAQRK